jgi:hypothetical protein
VPVVEPPLNGLLYSPFSGREPLYGWRDNSVESMRTQMSWAHQDGIEFFLFDWCRGNVDPCLDVGSRTTSRSAITTVSVSPAPRAQRRVAHHNAHRPHRALEQQPPILKPIPHTPPNEARVRRRDRLRGLLHKYELAA